MKLLFSRAATAAAIAILTLAPLASSAQADSITRGSAGSASGSATLVTGSALIVTSGSQLVVESLTTAGAVSTVVLKETATGAQHSLQLSGQLAKSSAWTAGKVVETTLTSAGTILSAAGKIIAFVPNELGRVLTHNSTY